MSTLVIGGDKYIVAIMLEINILLHALIGSNMAARRVIVWSPSLTIFLLYSLMFYPRRSNSDCKNLDNLLDQLTAGRIVSTISIGGTNIANKVKSDHNHDGYFKSGSISAVIVMLKYYTLAALLVTPGVCQCATISLYGDVQPYPGPLQSLENNLNAHFNLKPRGLCIGQWNVNHLNDSKLEKIKLALIGVDYSETRLDILVMNETFWDATTPLQLLSIPGFDLFRRDRVGKAGGGIAIYVNEVLIVKRRSDLEDKEIEAVWLELCPFKSKRKLILGGIYRPPNSVKIFDSKLGMNFENVSLLNLETIIVGDFNIDYLSNDYNSHRLVKTLKSLSFTQLVASVTRPVSGKCLDHIWSNKPQFLHKVSTIDISISDHLPIQCLLLFKSPQVTNRQKHSTITYRNMKNFNEKDFCLTSNETPWDTAFIFDDINDITDAWYCLLNSAIDEHAPLVTKRIRKRVKPQWLTDDITNLINKRNYLFKRAKNTQSEYDWRQVKVLRNKINQSITSAKQEYFKTSLIENRSNPKRLWQIMKSVSGDTHEANRIDEFIVDGLPYKDNVKIAQALNNHFVSLANQSANVNESLLKSAVSQSLFDIPEISANEIEKIIEQIPVSKATGSDRVSVKLIKAGAKAIAPSLSKLFKLCFSTATFPQIWKTAEVVPLFKNGDKTKADNYRPISILPVISKIIERHVLELLINYFFHLTMMKFRVCCW